MSGNVKKADVGKFDIPEPMEAGALTLAGFFQGVLSKGKAAAPVTTFWSRTRSISVKFWKGHFEAKETLIHGSTDGGDRERL